MHACMHACMHSCMHARNIKISIRGDLGRCTRSRRLLLHEPLCCCQLGITLSLMLALSYHDEPQHDLTQRYFGERRHIRLVRYDDAQLGLRCASLQSTPDCRCSRSREGSRCLVSFVDLVDTIEYNRGPFSGPLHKYDIQVPCHAADMRAVSHSRYVCSATQQACRNAPQTCPRCHPGGMSVVRHRRHATQQTGPLCHTSDMSAAPHGRHVHVRCATQPTGLLCTMAHLSPGRKVWAKQGLRKHDM